MLATFGKASAFTRMNFVLLALFLAIVLFFGGASRADVISQPVVQLASIVMLVIGLLQVDRAGWRQVRPAALFFLAVALVIAVQLVPLAPGVWETLPGRSHYVEPLALAGVPPTWRPISLTPDLTLNSLLAVLPPLAVVMAIGVIDTPLQRYLLPILIAGVGISAVIALLQIAGGGPYFYRITNIGAGVGVFANRNHQAVFVAAALPMLAAWASLPHADRNYRRLRFWLCLCGAAAAFPVLLITGSRAGLFLGVVAAILALLLPLRRSGKIKGESVLGGRARFLMLVPVGIGAVGVASAIFLSRDIALRRLLAPGELERRSENLPIYWEMIRQYFPFGSGFGSFDPIFRSWEPREALTTEYMNQAHNDLAQIFIEGGLAPGLLLAVLLVWFVARAGYLWSRKAESAHDLLGRAGSVIVLVILLSSLVEYPLRTPLMGVLIAVAICWMLPVPTAAAAPGERKDGVGSGAGLG